MVAIEREAISNKSQYAAIQSATHVELADKLGIKDTYYSSRNNTCNVMKSLCWLAYEQNRYEFLLSIVQFAADFEYPGTVASGPAAVVAPSPSTRCNIKSIRRRRIMVSASASGHPAAPASSKSIRRRSAVRDGQPFEDKEDHWERRCMSTWTRATLKDYAGLNKHAMGRQAEMEKQAVRLVFWDVPFISCVSPGDKIAFW